MSARRRGLRRGSLARGVRGGARGSSQGKKPSDDLPAVPSASVAITTARPQRANANQHPGQVVNDAKQTRRSSEQVKKDHEQAAAVAVTAAHNKKVRETKTLQTVAAIEDRAYQEDADYQQYAIRPDQRPVTKKTKVVNGELIVSV